MPIHDWTRVPSGLFHDFHQTWTIHLKMALNSGRLPKGLSALVEQRAGAKEPDVLTIESRKRKRPAFDDGTNVLTLERPAASIVRRTNKEIYADRANRVVVRHHLGRIVAVIEIVSPGNKDSRAAYRDFVEKTIDLLREGIHLLVVDLFPPSPRDPFGIHKAIWDEIHEEDFSFPKGKDRILASYQAGGEKVAYIEPVAVGDLLPEMPLFLATGVHIKVPLESTYESTWNATPEEMRTAVETGVMPEPDAEDD
jgi:hypothetical protein